MSVLKVGATGDVLLHSNVLRKAKIKSGYSFDEFFFSVSDFFTSVDVSIVNQESIVAGENFGISSFPKFNSPSEFLSTLKKLNISILNISNNHMLDKGENGLLASIKNIEDYGFSYVGACVNKDTPDSSAIIEDKGIKLGFLSYTDSSKLDVVGLEKVHVNFFKGESYAMRMNRRLSLIKKDIQMLQKKADVIVLSLHFGEEYHRQPNAFQREVVHSIAETGVDVIIGHHPHVLQPIKWVQNSKGKNVLVAYSLGNFYSGQLGLYRQIGGFFTFEIEKNGDEIVISSPKLTLTFVDVYDGCKIKPLSEYYLNKAKLKTGKDTFFDSNLVKDELVRALTSQSYFIQKNQEVIYE